MALFNKITKATQDVVRGTKDFTDIARQNSLIAEEQKQIIGLYQQIGRLYHETHEADSETQLGLLCLAVNAANERIVKYNEAIRQIKGTQRCPSCGSDIPLNSAFCGLCGAKAGAFEEAVANDPAKRHCKNCGTELSEGIAFCTFCGQRQE
jgi:predicted nucleic acid-binding Zn ribbon protein